MRWLLAGAVVIAAGCGSRATSRRGPATPADTPVPRAAVARAVIELASPTPRDLGGGAHVQDLPEPIRQALTTPPRTAEEALEAWALMLASNVVLDPASSEVGSSIDVEEVRVARAGRIVTLEVAGEGPQSAMARCLALVRAAQRYDHDGSEAALAWLRGEWRRLRTELNALEAATPRTNPPLPAETLEVARGRVRDSIARLEAEPRAPEAILGREPPELLRSAAERVLEIRAQRAELAARYGEHHPEMEANRAREALALEQLESQRKAELHAARALASELARSRRDPASVAKARRLAWIAHLASGEITAASGVASDAPFEVRLAMNAVREALRRVEDLATRYGEAHPSRVAAQALVESRSAQLETARQGALERLRSPISSDYSSDYSAAVAAEAGRRIRQEREMLSLVMDRIDLAERQRAEARGRYRVAGRCATVRE